MTQHTEIDIHAELARRRQVAIIWGVEDVQSVRPDLSDDQAWQVLQQCKREHGIHFDMSLAMIETVADEMFPPADVDATSNKGGGR